MVGSYTALDLAGRVTAAEGAVRRAWLAGGSIAMGIGIWSMHFVGMLAFQLPSVSIVYEPSLWLLSIGIAIGASLLALHAVSASHPRAPLLAAAGLLMGGAIAGMHYTGMAAMRIPGRISYDPLRVAVSVGIAIIASAAALGFSLHYRRPEGSGRWGKLLGAALMGLGISGMHYTAMAAAHFHLFPGVHAVTQTSRLVATNALAVAVAIGTSLILALAIVSTMIDRRIRQQFAGAERIRRSEERFRSLVAATSDLIFITAADGTFVDEQPGWTRLTGQDLEEMHGWGWLDALHPEDREGTAAIWAAALAARSAYEATYRVRNRDGEYRLVYARAVAVTASDGSLREWIGAITDVTEKKRAEEDLGVREEQLQQAQKMEAVGRLAGGVAHDFNNLLTVIKGNAELLTQDTPETDTRRQDIEEIARAADRAASLTRQLLAFSRRQVLQPSVLNLNDTVHHSLGMLRRLIRQNVEIATSLDPALGQVKADPHQIEQVLMNLVINARDAMPDGGRLEISSENRELTPDDQNIHPFINPGPFVLLRVRDFGCGMDRETLARAFEPFFTTKEQGKGTGLGLATVFGVVKQSGGYVLVDSEPGRGSTFDFYLPRIGELQPIDAPEAPPSTAQGGSEEVLLVEDEDAVRRLARKTLERHGYRVVEARDGEEGARIFEERRGAFALLLTDVMMPRMSGPALAERALALRPGLKVIFMSGYTGDELPVKAAEAAAAFIQKPFAPEFLIATVRDVLDPPRTAARENETKN